MSILHTSKMETHIAVPVEVTRGYWIPEMELDNQEQVVKYRVGSGNWELFKSNKCYDHRVTAPASLLLMFSL